MKLIKICFSILVLSVFIFGCKVHPKISMDKVEFSKEEKTITVNFNKAVKNSKDSKYWACVIPTKSKDSDWGTWSYVSDNATSVTITLKEGDKEGNYEIRLHSDYPKKKFNVVDRKTITIK